MEKLDLSNMARKIVGELRNDEPKRKVKVAIAPNMTANGDKNLLGLVLQNLLGNAWKYSSKTAEPRIEMGTVEHNGKQAYFVRDNGVGFDMAYADKLFQPFQRLHKAYRICGDRNWAGHRATHHPSPWRRSLGGIQGWRRSHVLLYFKLENGKLKSYNEKKRPLEKCPFRKKHETICNFTG